MNRAQRRKSGVTGKEPTYCFTKYQIKAMVDEAVERELAKEREEIERKAEDRATAIMFTLPMEVLIDHFWPKSYTKQIPKFANLLTEYYEKLSNGELDLLEMIDDLWKYAGIKLVTEDWGEKCQKN